MPGVYYQETERIKAAIRLPANRVLQERLGYLLTRGRASLEPGAPEKIIAAVRRGHQLLDSIH